MHLMLTLSQDDVYAAIRQALQEKGLIVPEELSKFRAVLNDESGLSITITDVETAPTPPVRRAPVEPEYKLAAPEKKAPRDRFTPGPRPQGSIHDLPSRSIDDDPLPSDDEIKSVSKSLEASGPERQGREPVGGMGVDDMGTNRDWIDEL